MEAWYQTNEVIAAVTGAVVAFVLIISYNWLRARRKRRLVSRLMLIAHAVEFHRAMVEPSRGQPVGVSERKVASLEARLGCRLPLAYREYLLWMGNDQDGLLRGTDCFLGNVEANEQALAELLRENGLPPPAYRPVVFFLHQGYIACWFRMGETAEDPEVFSFNEGAREAGIRPLGSFSHWLYSELSALAGLAGEC